MNGRGEYRKGKHNASTARESNSPIVTCASQMHPPSLVPQGKTGTTVIGKRGVNIMGAACIRSVIATLQHGQGTSIKIQPRGVQPSQGQAPSGTHTHTVIVIRFHSVQVQFVYMYLYSVSIVGAVIGPVSYRSYLCVWVPPLPYLTHLGFILGYSILTRTSNCLSLSYYPL